ncbi:5-oxoprolinase subunit PxpA [Corynebacterium callunae]|uniref:5-oxoprolinase subunit PxpA n=1 Tax=Corynebacterium callunae TaxID=1721 RepID=UPI003982855A
MTTIDLNSDLGESFGNWTMGNDNAVLDLVSSANIACGFHAGDPAVMLKTVGAAYARRVRIGAHIGYRDLAGFGRRFIDYSHEDLVAETIYQIGAIKAVATAAGAVVDYVKPHGALYNTIAGNESQADAVIEGITRVDPTLKLMALAGSNIVEQARGMGLQVQEEAFADRAYTADGQLVSRSQPGSVHHDPQVAAAQALAFAQGKPIKAITGEDVLVKADSLCVHGDNPAALALIKDIISTLSANGIKVSHGR